MTPLVEVRSLSKFYPIKRAGRGARLHAVDDVDLTIGAGESVGLVELTLLEKTPCMYLFQSKGIGVCLASKLFESDNGTLQGL